MAHFRATIKGRRGPASRLGDKGSGIGARVAGWDLGVDVDGHYFLGEHGPRGGERARWENGHNRFDISVDNGNGYKARYGMHLGTVELSETGRPVFTPSHEVIHDIVARDLAPTPDLTEYRAMTAMVALLLAAQARKPEAPVARDAAAVGIVRERRG